MNTATESICPKGWTLPTTKQIDNNRSATEFSPIQGGLYRNGTLYNEATLGYWWGSEFYNGAIRYYLSYYGSSLYTSNYYRNFGLYIRCVSEEKTVTDLTYLQDMTGEIADNTLDGYRELTTYDLVTYGKNTAGKNYCYGVWNDASQIGYGPGYQYNCIHSGTIKALGDLPTNWYNYTLASAGTIIDENTTSSNPATNANTATESICPKGWTLPAKVEIDSIGGRSPGSSTYIPNFSPVLGGLYTNGSLNGESTLGYWWGSEAYNNSTPRYFLYYNSSSLYTNRGYRYAGIYIRCVQAP